MESTESLVESKLSEPVMGETDQQQQPRKTRKSTVQKSIKTNLHNKLRKFTERASILYTDPDKYFNLARER